MTVGQCSRSLVVSFQSASSPVHRTSSGLCLGPWAVSEQYPMSPGSLTQSKSQKNQSNSAKVKALVKSLTLVKLFQNNSYSLLSTYIGLKGEFPPSWVIVMASRGPRKEEGFPAKPWAAAKEPVVAGSGGATWGKAAVSLHRGIFDEPPRYHRGLPGLAAGGWSERGLGGARRNQRRCQSFSQSIAQGQFTSGRCNEAGEASRKCSMRTSRRRWPLQLWG